MRYTKVSEALKALRKNQKFPSLGICHNVEFTMNGDSYIFYDVPNALREAFKEWPNFSGNLGFPIPDTRNNTTLDAVSMYFYAAEQNSVWSKRTAYGRLRYDLLEHCIKYFEERGM